MREYATIIDRQEDRDEDKTELFYLAPIGTNKPEHLILCLDAKDAHSLKLALGLGTQPDPSKKPHYYQLLPESFNGAPVYKVIKREEVQENWTDPGCCESGCPGCPWTLKNLGTN
jgi:hypothetical protein